MSTIGLLVLCVSIVAGYSQDDASEYFETFLRTYNKEYDEAEKQMRFEIFSNNLQKINILNEHSKTAKYGITKFTDLTPEEFLERHTGYKISNVTDACTGSNKINLKSVVAPDELDWRTKGVVTDVKNQHTCGSCWAFSATGNVESAYAIKTNQLVSLSEQELVDCDKSDLGCNGGYPIKAFKYFQDNGAMTEDDYPYEGVNGQCKFDSQKVKVKVSGCIVIQGSEDEIADNLAQIGPLSITVDATSLQQYSGGVITDSCQGTQINHAVLLVGYGKGDDGTPYWLVKNSWGAGWGESGYFRIQRGVNCLLITDIAPTSATVNA